MLKCLVAYSNKLSWQLLTDIEENHEKPQSR